MDIRLPTNAQDTSFALVGCHRLDETDYCCTVELRSGAFQATAEFWFDRVSLENFAHSVTEVQISLRGECRLEYRYEEPYIALSGDGLGHITVSGMLLDRSQQLKFQFTTDQTVLPQFAETLRTLVSL